MKKLLILTSLTFMAALPVQSWAQTTGGVGGTGAGVNTDQPPKALNIQQEKTRVINVQTDEKTRALNTPTDEKTRALKVPKTGVAPASIKGKPVTANVTTTNQQQPAKGIAMKGATTLNGAVNKNGMGNANGKIQNMDSTENSGSGMSGSTGGSTLIGGGGSGGSGGSMGGGGGSFGGGGSGGEMPHKLR